ncbi:hypothetical protein OEZ85_012816 [Tetradesmus obliquus]|uniref:Uncharacterized protein n=1 Tax=Tetradesmus obliquus TaxID=3088 RepID=A0ABY8U3Q9_TETOB|nr:hypothetical protein OEZ85_012816 [Tetradesmus obliquus]
MALPAPGGLTVSRGALAAAAKDGADVTKTWAITGFDLGSSAKKVASAEEGSTLLSSRQQQTHAAPVQFRDPFRSQDGPVPTSCTVKLELMTRPAGHNTRSGGPTNAPQTSHLVDGAHPGRNKAVVTDAKRAFHLKASAAGSRKVMEDIGFALASGEAAADSDGYVAIKVMFRGVPLIIKISDIYAFFMDKLLSSVHGLRRYSCIPVIALAAPDGCTRDYRACSAAALDYAVQKYDSSSGEFNMLRDNRAKPPVVMVPESVAAAQQLCGQLAKPERVLITDVGHSTMATCLIDYVPRHLPTVVLRLSNSFRGAQDIEHALVNMLAEQEQEQEQEQGVVLQQYVNDMIRDGSPAKGIRLKETIRKAVEAATDEVDQSDKGKRVSREDDDLDVLKPEGITLGEVQACSELVADAAKQMVEAAIEMGQQCSKPPTLLVLTGGGGMIPQLVKGIKDVAAAKLGQGVPVLVGEGGNSNVVAMGAAELGIFWLNAHHAGGQPLPQPGSPYQDLLPEHMSPEQLRDLSRRVHAAAKLPSGEPDLQQREQDQQQLQAHIKYHIKRKTTQRPRVDPALQADQPRAEPRPGPPTGLSFFYSVVTPLDQLPVQNVPLPWQLKAAPGSSSLTLQVVKIDPQFKYDEVLAASWTMQNPGPGQYISAAISVDEDSQLACSAMLHSSLDNAFQGVGG